MCFSAILGLGSAIVGAGSAKSAQKSQERAAADQLALQERVYDETVERFEPYSAAGLDYQNALRFELLGGERPTFGATTPQITEEVTRTPEVFYSGGDERGAGVGTTRYNETTSYNVNGQSFDTRDAAQAYADANTTGGQEYQGFELTPNYLFQLDQGQQAIDNSAASSGNLFSGATLKAQQQFGQGIASQGYENYLNRLAQGAASGQAAAANQANAGTNYAAGAGQAYANMGNAGAAGAIGVGNAIQGGIQNTLGLWNYQNQQSATPNSSGWLFGGNSWS